MRQAAGSAKPIWDTPETNEICTHVLVTLPIHPLAELNKSDQVRDQVSDQVTIRRGESQEVSNLEDVVFLSKQIDIHLSKQLSERVKLIIEQELNDKLISLLVYLTDIPRSRIELLAHIRLTNHTKHKKKYIDPLLNYAWVNYTIPKNLKDRNQKYTLSESGKRLLSIINKSN